MNIVTTDLPKRERETSTEKKNVQRIAEVRLRASLRGSVREGNRHRKSGILFRGLIGSELLCGLSRERSRGRRWSVGRKECPVGVPCFDQELTSDTSGADS